MREEVSVPFLIAGDVASEEVFPAVVERGLTTDAGDGEVEKAARVIVGEVVEFGAAVIDAGAEGVSAVDMGEVVVELVVGLEAVNGESAGGAEGGGRESGRVGDADDGGIVAAGDIDEGGSEAEPKAEFSGGGGREDLGGGEADVLLAIILDGGFAVDELSRLAALAAVLVAEGVEMARAGGVVELAGVVLIGERAGYLLGEAGGAEVGVVGIFGEAGEEGFEKRFVGGEVGVIVGIEAEAAVTDLDAGAGGEEPAGLGGVGFDFGTFEGVEEEELVFEDGGTDGVAELIAPVGGAGDDGGAIGAGAGGVVKEAVRVEDLVLEEFVGVAVDAVGAGFGLDEDGGAAAAELSGEGVREDDEFLDSGDVDVLAGHALRGVVVIDAVDLEGGGAGAGAVEGDVGAGRERGVVDAGVGAGGLEAGHHFHE